MRQRHFTRSSIATAFALAVLLMGATGILAGEPGAEPQMGHPSMGEPAMMEKDMMAMHQKMQAEMQAMDQKLDALVAEMDAAGGKRKTDAVAAVVAELVDQRKAMHGMMMEMQPRMMAGMMEGTKQSMGECPMMKQMPSADEQGEEDEHSAHHPEG